MKRIITGIAALACWLLLLYINSLQLFWFIITITAAIALNEYFNMVFKNEGGGFRLLFLGCGTLPLLASITGRCDLLSAALVVGFTILCALIIFTRASAVTPFKLISCSSFGILYCGFLPAHIIMIMGLKDGAIWLLFLSAITAASDSGAYFSGKTWGSHKLCPLISPKKTVEGFIGGLICGSGAATAIAAWLLPSTNILPVALVSLVLTCLGVLGDLTESVIKRAMKVKDSGVILPGHGGILDRADSLLLTAPVFYYMLHTGLL